MAKFGTQKEASRTKSIKFPFQYGRYKFIFLGIVFYQIVGLQVGQAEASWPRDTYGEYGKWVWKSVQWNLLLFLERVLLSVTVINMHFSYSDRFLTSSGTAQGEGLGRGIGLRN